MDIGLFLIELITIVSGVFCIGILLALLVCYIVFFKRRMYDESEPSSRGLLLAEIGRTVGILVIAVTQMLRFILVVGVASTPYILFYPMGYIILSISTGYWAIKITRIVLLQHRMKKFGSSNGTKPPILEE